MHSHVDINVSNLFTPASYSATRGHNYKIFKPQSSCLPQSRFFAIRSVNDWNSLSENIINATSISQFKQLLDHYWNNFLFLLIIIIRTCILCNYIVTLLTVHLLTGSAGFILPCNPNNNKFTRKFSKRGYFCGSNFNNNS